jgi:homoserine/homoserine lactone efflux protein
VVEWFSFVIIASLLVMAPGPNSLLIIQSVVSSGKRSGIFNIVGILSGFLTHALLSVFGLAAVVAHSTEVLVWIKWLGAAILVFLGVSAIKATLGQTSESGQAEILALPQEPWYQSLLKGLATCLLNPKIPLFYISVLPQFSRTGHFVEDALSLSLLHCFIAAIWFLLVVFAVTRLSAWISQPKINRRLKRMTGGFFIFLGAKTALQ